MKSRLLPARGSAESWFESGAAPSLSSAAARPGVTRRVRGHGRWLTVLSLLWMTWPGLVHAQTLPVGDTYERYLRILQLAGVARPGSFTVRPLSLAQADSTLEARPHPWSQAMSLGPTGEAGEFAWSTGESRFGLHVNTIFPVGWNDGALWQGKGVTTEAASRAWLRWKGLSLTVDPTVLFNQNADFVLAPVRVADEPVYAYPWRVIDYPQRFGPDAYWTFDLGQSQISLDWRGLRAGFGNESLWWGPGIQNAIVMSNNAPGFLHGSLSTNRAVDIRIGTLEAQWIWGRLAQSDYFNPTFTPTDRFITGAVFAFTPSFIDGLTVGATRIFQELVPSSGIEAGEYLVVFQGLLKKGFVTPDRPWGDDDRDQLASIFARWTFPESGFETYVEWARNDHAYDLEDFILQPDHTQGYTLGFQKLTSFNGRRAFVLRGELTHLESSPTWQAYGFRITYYEHHIVRQGYTNKGQVLGAMVGPGGNGEYLGVDWYDGWGSATFFLQRRVADNDAYWEWTETHERVAYLHDVSLDFGISGRWFLGDLELGAAAVATKQYNRYITLDRRISNFHGEVSAHWRPTGH